MSNIDLIRQLEAQAAQFEADAENCRAAVAVLADSNGNGKAANGQGVMLGGSRMEQIEAFLTQHGPATRGQIRRGLPHIPRGTIAALLNIKHFDHDESGKWSVKSGELTVQQYTNKKGPK